MKTTPHLVELNEQQKSQGLAVIGLTVEDPAKDIEKVRKFAGQLHVSYPVAFASKELYRFVTNRERIGIPKILVYDRSGKPVEYEIGYSFLTNRNISRAVAGVMSDRAGDALSHDVLSRRD